MLRLSEMVEEKKLELTEFITVLGYSDDEAKKFAEGYVEAVKKLPTLMHKLAALERLEDDCVSAGFKAAGINEDEALARFQEKFSQ